MLYIRIVLFILLLHPVAQAQVDIPIGTWRNHLSYQTGKKIALAGDKIYVATHNGLFFFDKSDNSLNPISKLNDLSESVVQNLAFDTSTQTLWIVYDNSNIDWLQENEITEFDLIKNADITGSKTIHHVYFAHQKAYLSSDFGVAILNLQTQDIQETLQNIGENGTSLQVFASTIANDSIFLATQTGIIKASLTSNLQDFNHWKKFDPSSGIPSSACQGIVTHNQRVYATIDGNGLYEYNFLGKWTKVSLPIENPTFNSLKVVNNQLVVSSQNQVWVLDNLNHVTTFTNHFITTAQDAELDTENKLWIADSQNGLVSDFTGDFQSYFPNGTARSEVWRINEGNNQILALSGGWGNNDVEKNTNFGFYQFENGIWTNYNAFDPIHAQAIPPLKDLIDAAYNPKDENWYISSFDKGILVKKPDNTFETFDHTNSSLQQESSGKVKTTGVSVDTEGNVWVCNYGVTSLQSSLHAKKTDGTWNAFSYPNTRYPMDVLIDFNGYKWVRLSPNKGGNIWVADDKNNRNIILNTTINSGSLPDNRVNALTMDLEGQIWVGTDKGVAVFFNPFEVFNGVINSFTPIFEQRPLLRSEKVNAIEVDGGNNKWLGFLMKMGANSYNTSLLKTALCYQIQC
jgi:hypothetical protein